MSAVKRNKGAIDMFEHAMQGVHTSNDHRIVRHSRERGLIGSRSHVEVIDALDDTPKEREVIVRMPRLPRERTR